MLKVLAASLVALAGAIAAQPASAEAPTAAAVAKTYADIAEAGYADSLAAARKLKTAIDTLIKSPTQDNLLAARKAWVDARVPYMQTEAFRFGNKIVDDWEPRVNAWPLDEGLIDYVSQEYVDQSPANDLYVANVIANPSIKINGEPVDTSKITKELLSDKLQEAGGVESNVATGYHAIEFLLWGQDLNGTGPGAGNRPATDYDVEELHPRQLRSPRAVSRGRHRPADRRSRLDGGAMGPGRRRAQERDDGRWQRRPRRPSSAASAASPTARWRASA